MRGSADGSGAAAESICDVVEATLDYIDSGHDPLRLPTIDTDIATTV